MKSLVVDTNRVIAALVKDSLSRMLLCSTLVTFYTMGFSKQEIMKHKEELLQKTALSESAFDALLARLYSKLRLIPDTIIQPYLQEAEQIMQIIDPDDVQFIAAALAMNSGIWSDDKHFQKQHRIKVWTTEALFQEVIRDAII